MTETIIVNESCETSMQKAAKKLNVTVNALKLALREFSKSMTVCGQTATEAFKEIAKELRKQKEDDCDEQFDFPIARFESRQGRLVGSRTPKRKPLQLESTYG